jgi:hypothetical protein
MKTNEDDDHHKDVFAHAGLALYFAQVFEESLIVYLASTTLKEKGHPHTHDEYIEIDSVFRARTLGSLIRDAKQKFSFTDDEAKIIDLALKDRNYLAHHFFKDHATKWTTENGRDFLIEHLESYKEHFEIATDAIDRHLVNVYKYYNITEEKLRLMVQAMIDSEHDG